MTLSTNSSSSDWNLGAMGFCLASPQKQQDWIASVLIRERWGYISREGGEKEREDREIAGCGGERNKRAMALYTCVDKGNESAPGFLQPWRSLQLPNSLGGQFWPQISNQWPWLPTYLCAYCLHGMDPFGSLRGHYSLQTASEVKSDLIFQISDLNYICCHVLGCSNMPHFVMEKEVFIWKRASPPRINKIGQVKASKDMAIYVIEVTDYNSGVRFDLWGCMEAVVASEAAKRTHTR